MRPSLRRKLGKAQLLNSSRGERVSDFGKGRCDGAVEEREWERARVWVACCAQSEEGCSEMQGGRR